MNVARFEEYQSKVGKENNLSWNIFFMDGLWFTSVCAKKREALILQHCRPLSSSVNAGHCRSCSCLFCLLSTAIVRPLKEFWLTVLFVYAFGQRWKGSSACVVMKHRTAPWSMLLPSNITSKNGKMFAQWLSLCLFVLMITVFVLLPWVQVSKNNSVFKGKHCSARCLIAKSLILRCDVLMLTAVDLIWLTGYLVSKNKIVVQSL